MKRQTKYQQIHDALLEEIRAGKYGAGDRLPSEKDLADRNHVSRITAKQALELLEEENWIVRRQGSGSFVTDRVLHVDETEEKETGSTESGKTEEEEAGDTIGVLFDNFDYAFGCILLETITFECSRRGIHMYFRCSYGSIDRERACINDFLNIGVKGMIIMCVHNDVYDDRILRLVVDNFPVILVDRDMANIDIPCVTTDNLEAAERMTDLLLAEGHKTVAFASHAGIHSNTIAERIRGVEQSLLRHGIIFDQSRNLSDLKSYAPTESEELDEEHEREDILESEKFMRENPDIHAYFAFQSSFGNILLAAARKLGIENDIDVALFDGPKRAFFPKPYFGRVLQDERQMGRVAVELLLKRMEGESLPKRTYIPYTIERQKPGGR